MCIMKSSSCNTCKVLHLFWPDVMLPCFLHCLLCTGTPGLPLAFGEGL